MKYKIICLAAAVGLLLASLLFVGLKKEEPIFRYHQHLAQPSEADLGPCTVCGGQAELCTHLPILRIETGGQKIPGAAILDENRLTVGYETGENGEELIPVSLETVETEGQWHHNEDPADQGATAMFRYRGNTSRSFSKHSFLVKLVQDADPLQSRDLPLLGMASDSEWSLHGPFLDKTLLRNYMWMNLSAEIMGYAPNVRFCELILDGEYQGVYVLMETIRKDDNRVNLTDYEPGDPVCSYIVRIGSKMDPAKTIDTFYQYTYRLESSQDVEVLYPPTQLQTERVHEYIAADFNEIERLLNSVHMNDGSRAYQELLDVGSFIDYYILQEFLLVNDAFSESTYFYRDVRGDLHIGPVWDYNNVLDNFLRPMPTETFLLAQRGWYGQLMQDPVFVKGIIDRYRELREGILSEERLNTYLDETIQWLGSAVERNDAVWGYTYELTGLSNLEYRRYPKAEVEALAEMGDLTQEEADAIRIQAARDLNPQSYEQAVDWMRTTINQRGTWMDTHIESLRQYCADSKNATRLSN